jgi:hypothetical protein
MPRDTYREPDEDDDYDESDDYDAYRDYDPDEPETYPEGLYDDDGPPLIPCPYCKREIAEESERCPHCENYLSREDAPPASKSKLWIALMVFALLAAALWVAGR